jgi:hypothetical protein
MNDFSGSGFWILNSDFCFQSREVHVCSFVYKLWWSGKGFFRLTEKDYTVTLSVSLISFTAACTTSWKAFYSTQTEMQSVRSQLYTVQQGSYTPVGCPLLLLSTAQFTIIVYAQKTGKRQAYFACSRKLSWSVIIASYSSANRFSVLVSG